MTNLNNQQSKFLMTILPVDMLKKSKPTSVSGVAFKESWVKYLNENGSNFTFNAANSFLKGASALTVSDFAVKEMYDYVINTMRSEPFTAKLSIIAENTMNSNDALSKSLFERIESLLALEESEIKTKLANGILDSFKSMYGISDIISEASSDRVVTPTDSVNVYTPISYMVESDKNVICRIGRYVLNVNESGISQCNVPSDRFAYLSSIVEYVKFDKVEEAFTIDTNFGSYKITESGLFMNNEAITLEAFMSKSKVVIESKATNNALSRSLVETDKRIADAIISLVENFDDIIQLTNARVAENTRFDEKVIIMSHKNDHVIMVESSKRYPTSFTKYKTITEAVERFKVLTSTDVSEAFSAELRTAAAASEKSAQMIDEHNKVISAIQEKINETTKKMATVERGSEAHGLYVEAISRANALIVEQQQKIMNIVKSGK